MAYELLKEGIKVETEVFIPIQYKEILIPSAFRADIIVEDEIILELKSTEQDNPLYTKQLNTYLRLSGKRLGLLINFNKERVIEGITRVVHNF